MHVRCARSNACTWIRGVARQVAELSADVFQRLMGGVQAALHNHLQQYTSIGPPPLPGQPQASSVAVENEAMTSRAAAAAAAPWSRPPHPLGMMEEDGMCTEMNMQPIAAASQPTLMQLMRPLPPNERRRSSVSSAMTRRRSSVSSAACGGKKNSVMLKSIPSTVKEAAPMELTEEKEQRIISTIKQNVIFANLEPLQLKVSGVRSVSFPFVEFPHRASEP